MSFHSVAQAISYPVFNTNFVGEVTVNTLDSGVYGGFQSYVGSPPSLNAAAQAGNDHHFNWFQVIISDNDAPNNENGVKLVPPYIDPPFGGYGSPDTHWADRLPWLWDEGLDPPGGTPGFENGYNVNDVLFDESPVDGVKDHLLFEDFPGGFTGSSVSFQTWLVSVDAAGSLHDFYEGFQWTWSNPSGGDGMSTILPTLLTSAQGLAMYNQVMLPDYNHNGTVDAADYVVWRKIGGTPAAYNSWRNNFGQAAGNGTSISEGANVPEPTTSAMLIMAAVGVCMRRRPLALRAR